MTNLFYPQTAEEAQAWIDAWAIYYYTLPYLVALWMG